MKTVIIITIIINKGQRTACIQCAVAMKEKDV